MDRRELLKSLTAALVGAGYLGALAHQTVAKEQIVPVTATGKNVITMMPDWLFEIGEAYPGLSEGTTTTMRLRSGVRRARAYANLFGAELYLCIPVTQQWILFQRSYLPLVVTNWNGQGVRHRFDARSVREFDKLTYVTKTGEVKTITPYTTPNLDPEIENVQTIVAESAARITVPSGSFDHYLQRLGEAGIR